MSTGGLSVPNDKPLQFIPTTHVHESGLEEHRLPLQHRVREIIDNFGVPLPRKYHMSLHLLLGEQKKAAGT
ncbi:hypothetical protein ACLOJK_028344 [Asimina triloba]